jgi:hypothetical protein
VRYLALASSFLLVSCVTGPVDYSSLSPAKRQADLNQIADKCRLHRDFFTIGQGAELHVRPNPDDAYENVDCALAELKKFTGIRMGFVGNEVDEDAVLKRPYAYIAGSSLSALESLAAEVRSAGWVVEKLAKADDGTGFLTFRSPDGATYRQAKPFMNRLFDHRLGEITFGPVPSKDGSFVED